MISLSQAANTDACSTCAISTRNIPFYSSASVVMYVSPRMRAARIVLCSLPFVYLTRQSLICACLVIPVRRLEAARTNTPSSSYVSKGIVELKSKPDQQESNRIRIQEENSENRQLHQIYIPFFLHLKYKSDSFKKTWPSVSYYGCACALLK